MFFLPTHLHTHIHWDFSEIKLVTAPLLLNTSVFIKLLFKPVFKRGQLQDKSFCMFHMSEIHISIFLAIQIRDSQTRE